MIYAAPLEYLPFLDSTLSQSHCTALTADICFPLRVGKGIVKNLWKTVEIPTRHVRPQCIAIWSNLHLYQD